MIPIRFDGRFLSCNGKRVRLWRQQRLLLWTLEAVRPGYVTDSITPYSGRTWTTARDLRTSFSALGIPDVIRRVEAGKPWRGYQLVVPVEIVGRGNDLDFIGASMSSAAGRRPTRQTRTRMRDAQRARYRSDPGVAARLKAGFDRVLGIAWTDEMDATLIEMRAAGAPFDTIADRVGVGRHQLMKRVRHLGISTHALNRGPISGAIVVHMPGAAAMHMRAPA